ncbi:hypothetical protein CNR22_21985 [Sphingobacteriaceae bacterium]|nr:hypothetical protein CNR22_21985 [Sphingobacteriaceae bacterium]
MNFQKIKIFIFLFILQNLITNAQREGFTRYTTREGLLSDEVYNLHQDKSGYIWLFTNYGVLKYNSVEFKPVLKNLPFSESFIYSIYENKNGEKWVANSNAKFYKIINDSAFLVNVPSAISEKLKQNVCEIYQLYVDDSLNIYAITKQYNYKFLRQGNSYIPIDLADQIKGDTISIRVFERGNTLFAVSKYFDKEIYNFYRPNDKLGMVLESNGNLIYGEVDRKANGAPRLFKKSSNGIYFSFYNRLVRFSQKKPMAYNGFSSFITNFAIDKNDHKWVACLNNGIYELNEKDSIINHYLKNTTVNDVLIDSQNGLWASTPGLGLFHYENINNSHFSGNSLLSHSINYLKIIDNELYVATSNDDVFKIRNNQIEAIYQHNETADPFYKSESTLDIAKFDGNYFLSFMYSLKKKKIGAGKSTNSWNLKKMQNIQKFIYKKSDTIVYLQRRGFGAIVKEELIKRFDVNSKTLDCEYRKGDLIVATENGLYLCDLGIFRSPETFKDAWRVVKVELDRPVYLKSTEHKIIRKITKDKYDNFWFSSTGYGIFFLDKHDNLINISTKEGLPSDIVNAVNFTEQDAILLSTNKGLFYAQSNRNNPMLLKWVRIYTGDVQNAVYFEKKIYMATKNGLVIVDYDKIATEENINFNLNKIYVNSVEQPTTVLKSLSYYENNIEFDFDLIHFSNSKTEIKYILSGPAIESGLTYGTSIKFQKLPPGNYTLNTYPAIIQGENFKLVVPFSIVPAFWQTPYFVVVVAVIIILTIILSLSLVFKNLKNRRTRKENAERLIMEYKLIALKAQINPHFMSNCLSAIQLLIVNNRVEAATKYIAKFGLLVRQILNFSTRSLATVREELEIAVLNMDLEQLRFENKFNYEIHVGEDIDQEKIYVPALILNPLIENTIWHGLLPLKNLRKGKLIISIVKDSDILKIIIEDNGVGRQTKKKNIGNIRQSKGLQLTEQRLSNINYLFAINTADILYTDLVDEKNAPCGTRVTIQLPLNLSPLVYE